MYHVMKSFGGYIEELRQEKGVTPEELARRLELSPSTTRSYIRHQYGRCTLLRIQEILRALEYPEGTMPHLKKSPPTAKQKPPSACVGGGYFMCLRGNRADGNQ